MPDRTAHSGAELLQSILGFGETVGLVERVVDSGRRVPVVIKRAAVERVASRPRDRIYKARSASINRRVRAHRNLKLLYRVLAKEVRDTVTAYNVGEVVARGVASVNSEGIGAVSIGVSRIFPALLPGNAHKAGVAVGAGIRSE